MKDYKEIDLWAGCSIERAVARLKDCKLKEELACCNFNGKILYSDTVTLDNAYKQITGKTKEECKQSYKDWCDEYDREKEEFRKTIPELTKVWIEKGKQILDEDKWDYWAEIVPIRLSDLYQGVELGCCLDIVKILNDGGTLEQAKIIIDNQSHSSMSFGLTCSMVREFCKRGEEFVKYIY